MLPAPLKLSLTTRIFLGYAVVLVTFGAVSLFSVIELRRSQVEIRLVSEGYLRLSQTVAAIETFQTNQSKDTKRLREEENIETRRSLIRLARLYFPGLVVDKLKDGRVTATRLLQFAPASERTYVHRIIDEFKELEQHFEDYEAKVDRLFSLLHTDAADSAATQRQIDLLQQEENILSSGIRLLHGSLTARIHERIRRAQERERRMGVVIIALPIVAIIVGLLATGLAAKHLRPVRILIDGVSRIGRGDYDSKLGITGDDEIAVLAREFDAMAQALKEREIQLHQKQQELLRAERLAAVGRASAQVAHEIRNPLSSIGLNVEMIQEQFSVAQFKTTEAEQESKELLASVTREIDRITEITEEYLRLARLPSLVLRKEEIAPLLDAVLDFAAEELQRAGITVTRDWGDERLFISADEGQLRQVFINLVRNAREAMSHGGGELKLSIRKMNKIIKIIVMDTGVGMDATVRNHLFEPFFTTKRGGTGLGLSLSRQILETHGGHVTVESEVGDGTRFIITLPEAAQ